MASLRHPIPVQHIEGAQARFDGLSASLFDDIDEQAASLNGWNQNYLQLSAGIFQGSVDRLNLEGVSLFIEDLHQAVHQTGKVRPDVVAFGVPLLLNGDALFCGHVGTGCELHVFSGTEGFEFRSPQRHVMLGIEIDLPLFHALFCDDTLDRANAIAEKAHLHFGEPAAIEALRNCAQELFSAARQNPAWLASAVQSGHVHDGLLDKLIAVLGDCTGHSSPKNDRRGTSASHAALERRAHELVMSQLDEPPTVAELCKLLGVSRRTLQNCFQATWGMGPLAWLNTLRLNAVRLRLKSAATVTEAATQFGFWHFGHFASDYHALFGELPSDMLCKHRNRNARATNGHTRTG